MKNEGVASWTVGNSQPPTSPENAEAGADNNNQKFKIRQILCFFGPGLLMSIAYIDPGTIESDLRSGSLAGYKLLWILLLAHICCLMLQRLAARLGVVSNMHLAEVAYEYYPKVPRIFLWIMVEVTIIAADMQEVIGSAIAIHLLSRGVVPLWAGVVITIVDTLTFLLMDKYGLRKLEMVFFFLIGVMICTFGAEYILVRPNQLDVVKGVFVPQISNWSENVLEQAVGIIGAVIMPHNLYLHSGLVKSKSVDRTKSSAVSMANFFFLLESGFALSISFIINLFIVSVFAAGLVGRSNADIRNLCRSKNDSAYLMFTNDTDEVDVDVYNGGLYLGCKFGAFATYIWAIGVFASGQSSTMAGCYTGQFAMEGFLKINWARWKRVLFSRSIAVVPTALVAILNDVHRLTDLNDILNTFMMMQLPFALLPLLTFTSSERIMREFRLSRGLRVITFIVALGAICVNLYFLFTFITGKAPHRWTTFMAMSLVFLAYFMFVLYLSVYCLEALGLNMPSKCRRLFPYNNQMNIDAPWLASRNRSEMKPNVEQVIE